MTALAAAADPSISGGLVAFVVLVLVVGYGLACTFWPWTACSWCDGGKKRSPSGKAWRTCRHCGGSGRKVRLGRKAWTFATRTRRDSE